MNRMSLLVCSVALGVTGCTPLTRLLTPEPAVARAVAAEPAPAAAPIQFKLLPPTEKPPEQSSLRHVSHAEPEAIKTLPAASTPPKAEPIPAMPSRVVPSVPPSHESLPAIPTVPSALKRPTVPPSVAATPAATPPAQPAAKPVATEVPLEEVVNRISRKSQAQLVNSNAIPPQELQPHMVPITLDAVLRLAQDQNGQIAIAREKLNEAFACKCLTDKNWMPDLYFGASYYRHEGGIQDFNGDLVRSSFGSLFAGLELRGKLDLRDMVYAKVDAERKIWQQRGELARLTTENLLDAVNTYVDLLAARSGAVIGRDLENKLKILLDLTKKRAGIDKGAMVEVYAVQTELASQQQLNRKLREGAGAAAARLVYLLNLDPSTELVPLDRQLVPFELVGPTASTQALVERALSFGPGIREMSGLLGMIENARAKSQGMGQYLPTLEVTVAEGGFGAGQGSRSNWDNRTDIALQARWNLTDLFTSSERQALAQSKYQQAQLSFHDLQGKLTMGVQEAREASLSGLEQIEFGKSQLKHALDRYSLSHFRLTNGIKGNSPTEVQFAIKMLTGAHYDLIRAIREYDKAQLRLFVLTGMVDHPPTNMRGRQ